MQRGWRCDARLTASRMRALFTDCSRRPRVGDWTTPLGVLRRSILGHASAKVMRASARNSSSYLAPTDVVTNRRRRFATTEEFG